MAGFEISVEIEGGDVAQLDVEPSYTIEAVKQKLQSHVRSTVEVAMRIRVLIHGKDMTQEVLSFNSAAEVRAAVADLLGCQPAFVALTVLTYDSNDPSSARWAATRLQDDQPCIMPESFSEACEAFSQSYDLTERAAELLKRLPLEMQRTTCACTNWPSDASDFIDQLATLQGITLESPILGADVAAEVDRTQEKKGQAENLFLLAV